VARHTLNKKRPGGPMPPLASAFETISLAKVSRSAAEAFELLYFRPGDAITMNRDRVLADAKAKALALVPGYAPPPKPELQMPGPTARVALELAVTGFVKNGKATAHDGTVLAHLARVVSGGDTDITQVTTEKDLLALEREAVTALLKTTPTLDRLEHTLETGKPLRN
jgi:3-hydroxyacyl-CoA dehydrogenase